MSYIFELERESSVQGLQRPIAPNVLRVGCTYSIPNGCIRFATATQQISILIKLARPSERHAGLFPLAPRCLSPAGANRPPPVGAPCPLNVDNDQRRLLGHERSACSCRQLISGSYDRRSTHFQS